MNDEPNTIMDAGNLAEELDPDFEDIETADLTSTHKAEGRGMEFVVRMDGYTLGNFEEMVIQTAARILLDQISGSEDGGRRRLSKIIEESATEAITAATDARLKDVTAQIMDMPVQPIVKGSKAEPMTIGQFIEMFGRDYLTAKVKTNGEPARWMDSGQPRINTFIGNVIDQKFKKELSSSVDAMLKDVRAQLQAQFADFVAAERDRISKAIGYEIAARR